MKNSRIGRLLAALCLIHGTASPSSPDSIRSASDALRELDFQHLPPVLTTEATRWLLHSARLDWPMERPAHGWNYDWVVAVPSPGFRFCVLSGAKRGEWGQHGQARYCLVDSTGRGLWIRNAEICAPPAVSDQGVVALLMPDGERPSLEVMDTLRIDFIGPDGQTHGSALWGGRAPRERQRRAVDDPYGFSPDGRTFAITVNQPDSRQGSLEQSVLYSVEWTGVVRWSAVLGEMAPNELHFSPAGDRIALTNLRMASVWQPSRVCVFDSSGRPIVDVEVPEARGADGSVLDPRTNSLYAFSFRDGLLAVNLETGELTINAPPEPLVEMQRSAPPREAERARRLLLRVRDEMDR